MSGQATIGNDVTTYRRLQTLNKCLRSGPMRVGFHARRRSTVNGSYQFCLFNENFTIPSQTAKEWRLGKNPIVNVQWDITSDTHPHVFAPMTQQTDDGRRAGIQLFKTIGNHYHRVWIVRNKPEAVPLANTLYDLFTLQIVGRPYVWKPSRRYIFQERDDTVNPEAKEIERKERMGLAYNNAEFLWGDRKREPETKPEELLAKRGKLKEVLASPESALEAETEPDEIDPILEDFEAYVLELEKKYLDINHRALRCQGCTIHSGLILQ